MYALFLSTDEDGNIPEWKENMEKYDAEITALGERIMKYCPDQNIRLRAMSRLAFNHCEMGRKEIGRAMNVFLENLSQESRVIFLRRYWFCDTIAEIAERYGISESKVKIRLMRTRNQLADFLSKEGITV